MVLEKVIHSCEKCGAEFLDRRGAEACEKQAVPEVLQRGTVFVEEGFNGPERLHCIYIILTEKKGVVEKSHLRAYKGDFAGIRFCEEGRYDGGVGAFVVSKDGKSIDSPWQTRRLNNEEIEDIYSDDPIFRKLYDRVMGREEPKPQDR